MLFLLFFFSKSHLVYDVILVVVVVDDILDITIHDIFLKRTKLDNKKKPQANENIVVTLSMLLRAFRALFFSDYFKSKP